MCIERKCISSFNKFNTTPRCWLQLRSRSLSALPGQAIATMPLHRRSPGTRVVLDGVTRSHVVRQSACDSFERGSKQRAMPHIAAIYSDNAMSAVTVMKSATNAANNGAKDRRRCRGVGNTHGAPLGEDRSKKLRRASDPERRDAPFHLRSQYSDRICKQGRSRLKRVQQQRRGPND